ncbi:MAG TPA: DUF4232 domain-containing protein [Streptosporangiaceae bacterium]|nr:DUF4232 domain-containing protein [Streptosporangiaceae bacterium]
MAAFAGTAILAVALSRVPRPPPQQAVLLSCTTASLHADVTNVTNVTPAERANGTRYYLLEFTNTSHRSCVLNGYPRVAAFSGIREIGSPAALDHSVRPRAVTLEPGATANAELRYTETGSFQRDTCMPVVAPELRVYPPDSVKPTVVNWRAPVCSRPGPEFLVVQPVEPWTVRHPGSDR